MTDGGTRSHHYARQRSSGNVDHAMAVSNSHGILITMNDALLAVKESKPVADSRKGEPRDRLLATHDWPPFAP